MMEKDVGLLLAGGFIGMVFGLSKDIIFSWLKIGRVEKEPPKNPCSDHQEKLARIEERLEACEIGVSKVESRFFVIQETLDSINKTLAVLLDRSNRKREGD